jgi:pimeloyl-ACP methyl ester carboxylesterase
MARVPDGWREVMVGAGDASLEGFLAGPEDAGLVIFAHGSGSSRFSSRNIAVAAHLNDRGLATLLFDLLTAAEQEIDAVTREHRFDIDLLTRRLAGAIDWALERAPGRAIGLFGASTGAAAALRAAAARPAAVRAVVSRGGRPDLAGDALGRVAAPTLLIVGGRDEQVLALNREAAAQMAAPVTIEVVPGATHLFPESGAMERVEELAGAWLAERLA